MNNITEGAVFIYVYVYMYIFLLEKYVLLQYQ